MIKYRKFAKFLRQLDVNEGIFILTWNSGYRYSANALFTRKFKLGLSLTTENTDE